MSATLGIETFSFNGGTSGDPEVQTNTANGRRLLNDHPYFDSAQETRRVAFWLLDNDSFPDGVLQGDNEGRIPKLDTPRIPQNQGSGRALQPFVISNDRVKNFRAEFDHSIVGDIDVRVISANEAFVIRPYRLVSHGGGVKVQYLRNNDDYIQVDTSPPTGTGSRLKRNIRVSLSTAADGFDVDLNEGLFNGDGGPENWEDLTFSVERPDIEVQSSVVNGVGTVQVRLKSRPSIHNQKNLEATGATANIRDTPPSSFQQVGVKLESAFSLLRFNGNASETLVFDPTNWDQWQTVSLTSIDDGNTTHGIGGADTILPAIDGSVSRHDTFFANVPTPKGISVPIPDNDPVPVIPRVEQVLVNDGSASRSQITSLQVRFDTTVNHGNLSQAFEATNIDSGVSVGTIAVQAVDVAGKTVATLTFGGRSTVSRSTLANSLSDGNYRLDVSGARVLSRTGHRMNGSFVFGGQAASQQVSNDNFFRLYGDEDGDGDVDLDDLHDFFAPALFVLSKYVATLDADGDGDIDLDDLNDFFAPNLFKTRT